jgi:hypothetical protein
MAVEVAMASLFLELFMLAEALQEVIAPVPLGQVALVAVEMHQT